MKRLNQKGFTGFEIALLVLVLAALGFAGYTVWQKNKPDSQSQVAVEDTKKTEKEKTPETSSNTSAELVAGDFGQKGNYGTFQAEGYAKVLKELYDTTADCGMSNPGVECPKIDGVFFIITKTSNTKVLQYIDRNEPNYPANSLVMGCPVNGIINYSNMSDLASKSYTISKEDTAKILSSTADKPIRLEIKKDKQSFGKDAPNCYSDFTTYKVLN